MVSICCITTELPDEWGIEELELVLVGPNGSKDSRSLLANLLFG